MYKLQKNFIKFYSAIPEGPDEIFTDVLVYYSIGKSIKDTGFT